MPETVTHLLHPRDKSRGIVAGVGNPEGARIEGIRSGDRKVPDGGHRPVPGEKHGAACL